MTRKPARSLSTMLMLVTLDLATVTFLTTGCGPVIFRVDETRTAGACPWTDAESEIACASFRINREPLPFDYFNYRDGQPQSNHQTRRSSTSARSSESLTSCAPRCAEAISSSSTLFEVCCSSRCKPFWPPCDRKLGGFTVRSHDLSAAIDMDSCMVLVSWRTEN